MAQRKHQNNCNFFSTYLILSILPAEQSILTCVSAARVLQQLTCCCAQFSLYLLRSMYRNVDKNANQRKAALPNMSTYIWYTAHARHMQGRGGNYWFTLLDCTGKNTRRWPQISSKLRELSPHRKEKWRYMVGWHNTNSSQVHRCVRVHPTHG